MKHLIERLGNFSRFGQIMCNNFEIDDFIIACKKISNVFVILYFNVHYYCIISEVKIVFL